MTTITLNELENCETLDAGQLSRISGGLSWDLQMRLNQFGANLYARGQVLFNPHLIYNTITSSQRAWRVQYGRQMPYFFPMPQW